ncbi:MAG: hypothetical protein R6U98_24420, partial [Pirellulaceae bacterium]
DKSGEEIVEELYAFEDKGGSARGAHALCAPHRLAGVQPVKLRGLFDGRRTWGDVPAVRLGKGFPSYGGAPPPWANTSGGVTPVVRRRCTSTPVATGIAPRAGRHIGSSGPKNWSRICCRSPITT